MAIDTALTFLMIVVIMWSNKWNGIPQVGSERKYFWSRSSGCLYFNSKSVGYVVGALGIKASHKICV